jgi:gas vesicle protein
MFSRVRIAIRFFFVGLAVGVLLAPRSGEETRRLVREKADRILNDVLDAATLGTSQPVSVAGGAGTDDDADAPKSTRSGNGSRTRSRSRATADAEEAEAAAGAGS